MKASLSPQRWDQVQRLFDEVVDLAPEARAARLDEACRDDGDLRVEVESLLEAYAQADVLLQSLDRMVPSRPTYDADSASQTGRHLSQYEVLERLGGGGMGEVYKAHDTKLGRTVALKFLTPYLSHNTEAKARFVQEARAASALDHPNIGTIYEIGEADGQLFIAMAFYEGETLSKKMARGALSIDETLDVGEVVGVDRR